MVLSKGRDWNQPGSRVAKEGFKLQAEIGRSV